MRRYKYINKGLFAVNSLDSVSSILLAGIHHLLEQTRLLKWVPDIEQEKFKAAGQLDGWEFKLFSNWEILNGLKKFS